MERTRLSEILKFRRRIARRLFAPRHLRARRFVALRFAVRALAPHRQVGQISNSRSPRHFARCARPSEILKFHFPQRRPRRHSCRPWNCLRCRSHRCHRRRYRLCPRRFVNEPNLRCPCDYSHRHLRRPPRRHCLNFYSRRSSRQARPRG